jgi:hypothetical protein
MLPLAFPILQIRGSIVKIDTYMREFEILLKLRFQALPSLSSQGPFNSQPF